jgi:putative salt-induced outer membrane protein YdiY
MSPLPLLVLLAQAPAPTEPAPPELPPCEEEDEEESSPWDVAAGLGLSFFSGNSRAYTLTGDVLAEYNSPQWVFTLEGDGAYGRAAAAGDAEREVTAEELGGWVRTERRFTPLLGAYVFLGASTDHLANLALRTEAELGVDFTLLERVEDEDDEALLRVFVGGHFAHDERTAYDAGEAELEDVNLWSPALALTFQYDLNERVHLRQDGRVLPNIVGDSRVLLESTTKLSVQMTSHFALTTFFKLKHDSEPAAGAVPTDTVLTLGGEFTL